jgi:hypothetical protein
MGVCEKFVCPEKSQKIAHLWTLVTVSEDLCGTYEMCNLRSYELLEHGSVVEHLLGNAWQTVPIHQFQAREK